VPALAAYGVAVLAAIPFMDRAPTFVGPVSAALGGLDLSNLVSFGLAGALFYALRTVQLNRAAAFRDAVAASRP
jgi:purine-cytosine permease-like protein